MASFHNITENLDEEIADLERQDKPLPLLYDQPVFVCGIIAVIASGWLLFPHLWDGVLMPLLTVAVGLFSCFFYLILNTVTSLGAAVILMLKGEPLAGIFDIWVTNNLLDNALLPALKELWTVVHTLLRTCWPLLLFFPAGRALTGIINRLIVLSSGKSYREYMEEDARITEIHAQKGRLVDRKAVIDPLRRLSDDYEVLCDLNVTFGGKTKKLDFVVVGPYADIHLIQTDTRRTSYTVDEYGNWDSPVKEALQLKDHLKNRLHQENYTMDPGYYVAMLYTLPPETPGQDSAAQNLAWHLAEERRHIYTADMLTALSDRIAGPKYAGRVFNKKAQQHILSLLLTDHSACAGAAHR